MDGEGDKFDLTYISFGAGVQSTALLAMSTLGMKGCPKADVAIFADTQAEIVDTYDNVRRMQAWAGERGIPVVTVTAGSLEKDAIEGVGRSHVNVPGFVKTVAGGRGVMRRHCTTDYKLVPIDREVRRRLGLTRKKAKGVVRVRAMLGISLDEAHRMKPSRYDWVVNCYPLVDARMTRHDCLGLLERQGIPKPPRSACRFCPFHRDHYWKWLKRERPGEFALAAEFDRRFRKSQPGLLGEAYVHESLRPLDQIEFDEPDPQTLLDGFGNECFGMCGV